MDQIVEFCTPRGVTLADREIADIGCGDGIIGLGLCHRIQPRRLVGFDVIPTNTEQLDEWARREGVDRGLPSTLEFAQSTAVHMPAPDQSFDFVYSWSAFEHIAAPTEVLEEVRRILRPTGHFFLQLWPFYMSAKGSHLWDWFEEDFHHLTASEGDIVAQVRASDRHPADWSAFMAHEFEQLNRITVAELQRCVLAAGFDTRWIELLTSPTHLSPALGRYSWSDVGVSGIKLLATPAR